MGFSKFCDLTHRDGGKGVMVLRNTIMRIPMSLVPCHLLAGMDIF